MSGRPAEQLYEEVTGHIEDFNDFLHRLVKGPERDSRDPGGPEQPAGMLAPQVAGMEGCGFWL